MRHRLLPVAAVLLSLTVASTIAQERAGSGAIARIRAEGLQRSRALAPTATVSL